MGFLEERISVNQVDDSFPHIKVLGLPPASECLLSLSQHSNTHFWPSDSFYSRLCPRSGFLHTLQPLLTLRIQQLRQATLASRHFCTFPTNQMPWKIEHLIHSLETLARSFGEEEPDPSEPNGSNDAEEEHSATVSHGEKHKRDSLRRQNVSILDAMVRLEGEGPLNCRTG